MIELLIKLKIEDVTTVTAKKTLTEDMGYGGILKNLFREEYWRIEVETENSEGAENLGKQLAEKRKIFVNPNKHTYEMAVNNENFAAGEEGSIVKEKGGEGKRGLQEVKALVSYREDEGALLTEETLRDALGYGKMIKGVQRGIIWTLLLKAESKRKARELARQIILSKSMEEGLLVNPHSQNYEILS